MSRTITTYDFTVLTPDEEDAVRELIQSSSWERALLDGRMLRFDRRPRFTQAFRHTIAESSMLTRSFADKNGVFIWLEADATSA